MSEKDALGVLGFWFVLLFVVGILAALGGKALVLIGMFWWLIPLAFCFVGYAKDRGKKWLGRPEGWK